MTRGRRRHPGGLHWVYVRPAASPGTPAVEGEQPMLKDITEAAREKPNLTIRAMTPEVIEARLAYQKPTPEQVRAMEELNGFIVDLGRAIGARCPEGMMKSKAVTDLVQLRMTLNAAVIGDGIPAGSLAK